MQASIWSLLFFSLVYHVSTYRTTPHGRVAMWTFIGEQNGTCGHGVFLLFSTRWRCWRGCSTTTFSEPSTPRSMVRITSDFSMSRRTVLFEGEGAEFGDGKQGSPVGWVTLASSFLLWVSAAYEMGLLKVVSSPSRALVRVRDWGSSLEHRKCEGGTHRSVPPIPWNGRWKTKDQAKIKGHRAGSHLNAQSSVNCQLPSQKIKHKGLKLFPRSPASFGCNRKQGRGGGQRAGAH